MPPHRSGYTPLHFVSVLDKSQKKRLSRSKTAGRPTSVWQATILSPKKPTNQGFTSNKFYPSQTCTFFNFCRTSILNKEVIKLTFARIVLIAEDYNL